RVTSADDSASVRGSNVRALRSAGEAAVRAVARVASNGDGSRVRGDVGSYRPLTEWQHHESAPATWVCTEVLVSRGGDRVGQLAYCQRGGAYNLMEKKQPFGTFVTMFPSNSEGPAGRIFSA